MSNTDGTRPLYKADLYQNMKAFDDLPKALRQALANSDHNWSASQLRLEYRKPKTKRREQFATGERAAQFIQDSDGAKHARDVLAGHVVPNFGRYSEALEDAYATAIATGATYHDHSL